MAWATSWVLFDAGMPVPMSRNWGTHDTRGHVSLNRTSTSPAGKPRRVSKRAPELYGNSLAGSAVPFTDTATGALAELNSARDVPPSGSLRNRRYVWPSVLADSTSPSVPVMYIRPMRAGLPTMLKPSVVLCAASVWPETNWLGY